jgi:hypothetical protein
LKLPCIIFYNGKPPFVVTCEVKIYVAERHILKLARTRMAGSFKRRIINFAVRKDADRCRFQSRLLVKSRPPSGSVPSRATSEKPP